MNDTKWNRQNEAWARLLGLWLVLLLAALACHPIPQGYYGVSKVVVRGNDEISESEIVGKIATQESPRALGLFEEVLYEPSLFSRFVLEKDLERIQRYYQARGFYRARALGAYALRLDEQHIAATIWVHEGPPTLVRELKLQGLEQDPRLEKIVRRQSEMDIGDRFEEKLFDKTVEAMRRSLTSRGYARAEVTSNAQVDLLAERADLTLSVTPGPLSVYGPIRLQGLEGLPEDVIRRTLDLEPGDPYSSEELESARQAVLELGVLQSANVTPVLDTPNGDESTIPIDVSLTPAKLRSLGLGGGVRIDTVQADTHGVISWENRNFLGGLRALTFELRPGVVFYPIRIDNIERPTNLLPYVSALGELRQPGLFEARTNGTLRAQYSIFPVISPEGTSDEVIGYREAIVKASLTRTVARYFRVGLSQKLQSEIRFSYTTDLEENIPPLLLSISELELAADFRDQILSPRRGVYLALPFQYAGLGGDARDIRIEPEVRTYIPLHRKLTLALRAAFGALVPFNYSSPGTSATEENIVFFRGFFAGGPASNRGYGVRGIGPRAEDLAFATPLCATAEDCETPRGGASSWEASVELRFSLGESLGVTAFCDAADVSSAEFDYRFQRPHLSCGPGLRYKTPVGALRADLGIRIPGAQVLDGSPLEDASDLLGLPIALALGLGEAF